MSLEQGGVLFLDISTEIGWAYGTLARVGPGPEWGVWLLPQYADFADKLIGLDNELADAIERFEPAVVGIEAPLPAHQQTNAHTAELLICLAGVAAMCARRWSRQFVRFPVNQLRAQVCGRSHRNEQEIDNRIHVKDAIVRPWIEGRGWDIGDNNARDAAVGWAFCLGIRSPKPGRRGPLL